MPDLTKADTTLCSYGREGAEMASSRRVSIICGTLLHYDAISECTVACMEAVASLRSDGVAIEVRIYCLESNIADSRVHVIDSVQTLIAEPFFQGSDIIIHHFGIVSELHGALAVAPRSAYVVVQFYGVTPPQFLPSTLERVISDSFIQIGLFENADEIVANSSYLEDELRRIGLNMPMRRIELFGVNIAPADAPSIMMPGPLNVVFCGRFVESKQVLPLIEALDTLAEEFPSLRLTLVGVANHSDSGYFAEVRSRAAASGFEIIFELNRTGEQVVEIIGAADLLVLPSLHEGFGMPVAEALAALTPVVCSDAGSLPEVAGGLALLFRSSDTSALTTALHAALTARRAGNVMTEAGLLPYPVWADHAYSFSKKYRREAFVERWRSATAEILARIGPHRLSNTPYDDVIRQVFPGKPAHDPGEAQLVGRFVMLKALGRINVDFAGTIDVLHRWSFGRPAEDQAKTYWNYELEQCCDINELVGKLEGSIDVRSSTLRSRSLAGFHATLIENAAAKKSLPVGDEDLELPDMSRTEVEHILKRSKDSIEFVKNAYIMILGRKYDPEGLKVHVSSAVSRDRWDSIIDSMYNSDEYRRKAKDTAF